VNIADVHSVFEWEARFENKPEKLLIIKSLKSRFSDIERLVKANHSYESPEIIGLEITTASRDYAAWVQGTCKSEK
jgi:periplasmic divalent cation tolerance protein